MIMTWGLGMVGFGYPWDKVQVWERCLGVSDSDTGEVLGIHWQDPWGLSLLPWFSNQVSTCTALGNSMGQGLDTWMGLGGCTCTLLVWICLSDCVVSLGEYTLNFKS